ncbi:MAG: flippase-like domain-containing protein [Chitinophagales bacterium]|nr:flippase-like domain-containing protein [Chitinophagales bacterium]
MKKYLNNIIQLVISLSLGVGIIVWMNSTLDAEQKSNIISAIKSANYFWMIVMILFGLLSNIFRTQRWRLLLKPSGYYPNFYNTFAAVTIMFFGNLFFPRLGEVVRCSILTKYDKVPIEKSIGSMVLERVIDLISILIIGGILFLVEQERLLTFFTGLFKKTESIEQESSNLKYYIFVGILVLAIVGFIYLYKKHGLEKITTFVKEKLKSLWESLISIRKLDNIGQFLICSIGVWVCYISMSYFGFKALTATENLGWSAAAATVFFGGFAMVATQGGIGLYQITIQKVLLTYGVIGTMGYAFGWLAWSVQTFFVIIGGIISLIFLALYNRTPKYIEQNHNNTTP